MQWNYASQRTCAACYEALPSDAPSYVRMCRRCYRTVKQRERDELLGEIESLRLENSRLRRASWGPQQPSALDSSMLRTLLQLCHPDRHDGSATATKATQYLLTLKHKAAGAVR